MNFKNHVSKKNYRWVKWSRIVLCSILVGVSVGLLTLMFKNLVEQYEHLLLDKAKKNNLFFVIFPFIGLTLIYFLRQFVFNKKKNKGITEVLEALRSQKKIPSYKVFSHFFNGFLTVIFGGTTGIEVSTVVATATLGDMASRKDVIFKKYRKEFMGAAIASGVTILFCSPLAGIFFSYETIGKQKSNVFWFTHILSVTFSTIILFLMNAHPLIDLSQRVKEWHYEAIPFFIILCGSTSIYGVYMTRIVTYSKRILLFENQPILQLLIGSILLGIVLYFLPELYGSGYHTIAELTKETNYVVEFALLALFLVIIKPFTTGFTLKLGGDGGVFAPSIFAGACLGLLVGVLTKVYFMPDVIVLNFIILGVAFTVAATLHAPFTGIFLTFGIFNSYVLWFPIVVLTFISYLLSKKIYPYTVYTLILKNDK
ncbi:chloride channel protein [Empedobacter falsenii]|uniref:Chloride channel protein n=1 Tax=Empedobacter falsenii TaxID=343874 RepID=A0A3R8ZA00_9FLAO|nr:chloride channel protein [Empedobacter falsenii]RRT93708.1 chloride channel protein [Empedobacter falsenii]RRT93863.1 chloride channel protein [Empedobacter falsenii]